MYIINVFWRGTLVYLRHLLVNFGRISLVRLATALLVRIERLLVYFLNVSSESSGNVSLQCFGSIIRIFNRGKFTVLWEYHRMFREVSLV